MILKTKMMSTFLQPRSHGQNIIGWYTSIITFISFPSFNTFLILFVAEGETEERAPHTLMRFLSFPLTPPKMRLGS